MRKADLKKAVRVIKREFKEYDFSNLGLWQEICDDARDSIESILNHGGMGGLTISERDYEVLTPIILRSFIKYLIAGHFTKGVRTALKALKV